jgi:hypothetical protein
VPDGADAEHVLRRKALISLLLLALALALVPTVLAAAVGPGPQGPSGAPAIRHTGETAPLFVASGLAAGSRVDTSVTIQNTGTVAGHYSLTARADAAARDLSVVVRRAADGAVLFSGPLSAARSVDVGVLAPRSATRLSLQVVAGSAGSAQGRGVSVTFRWRTTAA